MTSPVQWALWGPQFVLDTLPQGAAQSSWLPLRALVEDTNVLDERITQTSTALSAMGGGAEVEPRVAASLTQMGLVGRTLAAAIGLAVLELDAMPLLLGRAMFQSLPGPAHPLALQGPALSSTSPPTLQDTWVEQLCRLLAEHHHVAPQTLWGNVASVIHATRGIITRVTPEHADAVDAVTAHLLDHPAIDPAERRLALPFHRHSCCLLYRMNPDRTPVCGDCVLVHPDAH